MAQSRTSSNSADLVDVAEVMRAFEEMLKCRLILMCTVERAGVSAQMNWTLTAHDQAHEVGEVPSWASVRFHPGFPNHRNLESAILWAIYRLDFELAQVEAQKTKATE